MASVGVSQPAAKAGERRTRIAVFGGSKNRKVGRRTQAGKVFNRRNSKAANGLAGPKFTGAGGADLGLNEGVTPEGNLWQTWTPDVNPFTDDLSGPTGTSDSDLNSPVAQLGTLSTGAVGYYDPSTGKFIHYDFGSSSGD